MEKKKKINPIESKLRSKLMKDADFLKWKFLRRVGKPLNLENPQGFNEKIQWLKLNYHKPIMTLMADKYGVRELIKFTIGEKYLIPLIGYFNNVDDIDFNSLPEKFVLKASHGSGWNELVFDKDKLDIPKFKKRFKNYLKHNYYEYSKEWVYKHILPGIVCEEFLADTDGYPPKDHKIFCFNGEPKFIQVDSNKYRSQMRNLFDLEWNLLPLKISYPNNTDVVNPPVNLEEMIAIARRFAKGFPFIRVDLYTLNETIYFSEFTFYTDSGFKEVQPIEWEQKLGDMIDLNYRG